MIRAAARRRRSFAGRLRRAAEIYLLPLRLFADILLPRAAALTFTARALRLPCACAAAHAALMRAAVY